MATIVAAAGGGNWTAGGTWVGGVAPTINDDEVLDATSGNVTINAGAACRSIDGTNYTGTLTHASGATLSIGTTTVNPANFALKFGAAMTYTLGNVASSVLYFQGTVTTTLDIDFAGKTTGGVTFAPPVI